MRVALMIALLAAATTTAAQDANDEQLPIILTPSSTKVLPDLQSAIHTLPQCDSHGNLYSRIGLFNRLGTISKVSLDGPSQMYTVTVENPKGNMYFPAFHVTPDQRIWVLGSDKNGMYVFRFPEPSEPTKYDKITLQVPDGLTSLNVNSFVVLPKDNLLLMGYFGDDAPSEKKGHSYLAVFDSSGKVLRLSLEATTSEAIAYAKVWASETVAYQEESGGITYLLAHDRILVLSADGSITRTIPLLPVDKSYQANFFYMNRGRLIVSFYGPDVHPNKPLTHRYGLIDPSNGEVIRWYDAGPELSKAALVCFTDDGLVFTGSDHGHIKLMTAAIK